MHSRFILDCLKKGLWEGVSENESHESMMLKICVGMVFVIATPVSPLVAATIPVIGFKRVYDNTSFIGTKLFERCRIRREQIETVENKFSP